MWVDQKFGLTGLKQTIKDGILASQVQLLCNLSNIPALPGPNGLWDPNQARIKNPATGKVVFQLSGRFANPVSVQCDGSHLVAGYQSGEILILNLANVK